jgi:predicted enzyme related to lactoylglutathione lyase
MPTRDGYSEGIPCWVDLATVDLDRASAFYGPLLGWEFEPSSDRSGYYMAMRNGMPAAGIAKLPEPGMDPVWSTYFAVDDADDAADKIQEAGGQLTTGPEDVDGLGRLVFAKDTTGADFGVWQAGTHFGAAIVNEHGGLNWNELVTDEPELALSFYSRVFGHGNKTAQTPGGREYSMLEVGDREIAGVIAPRKPGGKSRWTVYFAVEDADEAAEVAASAGGEVHFGPISQPEVGTFVGLSDPDGADFTVIQLAVEID